MPDIGTLPDRPISDASFPSTPRHPELEADIAPSLRDGGFLDPPVKSAKPDRPGARSPGSIAVADALVAILPPHKCGLCLEHNPHLDYHQTVSQYEGDSSLEDEWISDAERAKAIGTGDLWVLQWFPDTPIGSMCIAASSLGALLSALPAVSGREYEARP